MTRTSKTAAKSLGFFFVALTALAGPAVAQTGDQGKSDGVAPATSAPASASAAASTTSAVPSSSATSGHVEGGMDGATYSVRLRDLEERIDELKGQIRRSHTRLSLLSDTILGGGVAGSRAKLSFENKMSGAFRLTRAVFVLDGAVQYNKSDDTGALSAQATIPIYTGSIPPGDHTLQIMLEYKGHGYGVFSYVKGYKFEVRSSHSFTVTEGKMMHVRAVAYEKGGVTTPIEQRPAIRFNERATRLKADSGEKTETPASGKQDGKPATTSSVGGSLSIGGK